MQRKTKSKLDRHFDRYKYRDRLFTNINNIGMLTVLLLFYFHLKFDELPLGRTIDSIETFRFIIAKILLCLSVISWVHQVASLLFFLSYFFYYYRKSPEKLKK